MRFNIQVSTWVATVFYVGRLPLAPGTWGSAVALIVWFILPNMTVRLNLVVIGVLFVLGGIAANRVAESEKDPDPSMVVIDEWVGMWVSLFALPKDLMWMISCFLLFRFYDIVKLYPMRQLERIRGGWGIMLDDVVAGLYALTTIEIFRLMG